VMSSFSGIVTSYLKDTTTLVVDQVKL